MSLLPGLVKRVTTKKSLEAADCRRNECKVCPLANIEDNHNPNMPPSGVDDPLVYVLGDAPWKLEDRADEPFAGDRGKLLRKLLPRDFRDDRVRYNNVVRTRPEYPAKVPPWAAVECCRPSIERDIEKTKPKIIFGLGNVPLNWMMPGSSFDGIEVWRGRRMPVKIGKHVCWFYPIFHPTTLYNAQFESRDGERFPSEDEKVTKLDIKRAIDDLDNLPTPVVHDVKDVFKDIELLAGGSDIVGRLANWLKWAHKQPALGFDYETDRLRPYFKDARILTFGLCTDVSGFACALDHPEASLTRDQKEQIRDLLVRFLKTYRGRIYVHNLAFELEWSAVYFKDRELVRAADWHDTMSQAGILDERVGERKPGAFSLEFLVQLHFGFNLKKLSNLDKERLAYEPLTPLLMYNGGDCRYHYNLGVLQDKLIEAEGLEYPYHLALRRVFTVVLSQIKGVPVDREVNIALNKKYQKRIDAAEDAINALPVIQDFKKRKGVKFSPSSTKDVLYVFKDMLKRSECKVFDKWSRKEKFSVDKVVLDTIDHPLAAAILAYREPAKRLSTYILPLDPTYAETVVRGDGMLHTTYNTVFAETGRLCVRKGTQIQVPGGTKSIEHIQPGDWVYCYDSELRLVLRRVVNRWYTGKKKLVRLHWRGSGNRHRGHLDVTPDHKIRLISGEYVEAQNLSGASFKIKHSNGVRQYAGARVLSLHRAVKAGRNWLYATGAPERKEARFVFEEVHRWSPEHVHHKDINSLNDDPINLQGMTHKEHTSLHARLVPSGEMSRRMLRRSSETVKRVMAAVVAGSRARMLSKFTKAQVLQALKEGRGIKGACRILGCDYSVVRKRIDLWGIPNSAYDGRSMRLTRLERRRNLHPYKGRTEYLSGPKYNHVITSVEHLSGAYPVYDLEIDGEHNFIANELCVHNSSEEPNLQNFPKRDAEAKEARKQVVAAPGCLMAAIDFGQIEARVIAMITKDKLFTKALWEDYDVHMEWAERISRAYPDRVGGKKNFTDKKVMKDFRTDIKNQWTFPLFFGAKLKSAAGYLKIPEKTLEPLYKEFWREFHGVKDWQDDLVASYREHGYVECMTGRRRRGPLSLNQIINSPVQGSAAEIVMDAMSRLSEIGDPILQPEINVHDDLTFLRIPEAPSSTCDDYIERIITEMLCTPFKWAKHVPLTAEIAIGRNWCPYDKDTNPDGLRDVATFSSAKW